MSEVSIKEAFAKCFPLLGLDCDLADLQKITQSDQRRMSKCLVAAGWKNRVSSTLATDAIRRVLCVQEMRMRVIKSLIFDIRKIAHVRISFLGNFKSIFK